MPIPVVYPDDHADRPVEQLSPDITVQWIDGGRILVNQIKTSDHAAFDKWCAWIDSTLADWPPERPYYVLYDLRSPEFGITLHMGTKLRQLIRAVGQKRNFTAIVYANKATVPTYITMLRLFRVPEHRIREYFTDYDAAVTWLKSHYIKDEILQIKAHETLSE